MTGTAPTTVFVIEEFFRRLGTGDRASVLDLFADEFDLLVAGADFVPWTGPRSTKGELDQFLAAVVAEVETREFAIDQVVVDGRDGVALGHATHLVCRTGRTFSGRFALHVVVAHGQIVKYHMFEDSHAIAEAFQ
jgi:uncharacterized protein